MATQPRRAGSDSTAAPVAFSYAQAAKGLSGTGPAANTASKPTSGTNTPSKDSRSNSIPNQVGSVPSWADDAEHDDSNNGPKPPIGRENRPQVTQSTKQPAPPPAAIASGGSSPDLGASSASTAVKDDDASSLPNAASESTWESKSQASTSVDKTSEPAETTAENADKGKGKGKNAEKPPKPLYEAPVPAVNPWARRMEEQKARVAQKPASKPAQANGIPQSPSDPTAKKSNEGKDKAVSATDGKARLEKENQARREPKQEMDAERSKKGSKGRPYDKDAKLPLPPTRDQESWPTPENAVDEERKKIQGKPEKVEKERKESGPVSKKEWVSMPYTPTVVFNTPLPSATSRRGGRGGSRGGAQSSGRGNFNTTSSGNADKDVSASTPLTNGDQVKRGRTDGSTARDASPKETRATSASSTTLKTGSSNEKGNKATVEAEGLSKSVPVAAESPANGVAPSQNNSFPRPFSSTRGKGRRGDFAANGDRRRDIDLQSPTKDGPGSFDKRAPASTQLDADEGERRTSALQDNQTSQPKPSSNDRRSFNSFSGRERGRVGNRGGRTYQNGNHQFANGATTAQPSTNFALTRSPTNFQPEQAAYFPPQPTPSRPYRNGPRQSVTNDNMYPRVPYQGVPQQLPHIQTYPMYDFIPPHTAVPFSPFGVDHWTMTTMVSNQVEYYFSVENLCKDIFLRKHMDSQGFVFLSVIADFNRMKQLTTNTDVIKHVCHASPTIEYRVGVDGKDRLRRREGWEQWVLTMAERDPSAQNDGPKELHNPPPPALNGFDPSALPRYAEMPMNGALHNGGADGSPGELKGKGDVNQGPWLEGGWENGTNNQVVDAQANGANDFDTPNGQPNGVNGHPVESSINNAVSGESDSFSNQQVESLSVIVRKQDGQPQKAPLSLSALRTFSNGSIDSRCGVPNEPPRRSKGNDPESLSRTLLYWVKGKDTPVESLPPDSSYESYTDLRTKALEQREASTVGSCPYDMDVLYQFWSHFLIRNFNTTMYEEFRQFAFEDAVHNRSDIGLANLIKYYGESLLSSQSLIRERVAQDYADMVRTENDLRRPAFLSLRSALRHGRVAIQNRKRMHGFLDPELRASLE